jgi:hypothetical protein
MLVVALACLVVVAEHANALRYQRKSIFELVYAAAYRFGYLPDSYLHECPFRQGNALAEQELGIHVGVYTNKKRLLSNGPTPLRRSFDSLRSG